MKRIYLIRHGESEANIAHAFQGSTGPLSSHGKDQAVFLAHRIERLPIDIILASPYERTRETTEVILKHLERPVEWRDDIVEKRHPSVMVGMQGDDPRALAIRAEIMAHGDDESYRHSDEEVFSEFRDRALGFLAYLESRSEEHILVVSHGGFMRMLLATIIFGEKVTHAEFNHIFKVFRIKNTGITALDYMPEYGWLLQTWNDHAHLN
ncbi:MAG: histidine phosphatase family protein [Patescibacteria group bacterium]